MKKKIIAAIIAVSCVGFSVGSAFAVTNCSSVSVQMVGTSPTAVSGLFVRVKNETTAACGALLPQSSMTYFLDTKMADQTYATVLTALSLQKKMWIQVGGTGSQNSLLLIASIKN